MNTDGLIVGAATFIIIALSRYACIKAEYYFTKKILIVFLLIGVAAVVSALLERNIILSSVLAIFGFSFLWGIGEVIEQEKRVEKGWFPKNPKRK